MSKAVDEILNSIIEDFKAGRRGKEELEAKALVSAVELFATRE